MQKCWIGDLITSSCIQLFLVELQYLFRTSHAIAKPAPNAYFHDPITSLLCKAKELDWMTSLRHHVFSSSWSSCST
ncbi:unnamed protein product [Albugo candida]|uniref:Uncharacterized protein n=1 Tax=Albugo candida TaxID=65357 RepID=A0A024G218_9STRA|nr:unnamed protein product [Albugo candida]|eukprot:CCI40348.1 unnamed protein product [Albugo candida]